VGLCNDLPGGLYKMEEILHSESEHPLKLGQVFMPEESRALSPSLFLSA